MDLCDLGTGDLLSDQLVVLALTEAQATLVVWSGKMEAGLTCASLVLNVTFGLGTEPSVRRLSKGMWLPPSKRSQPMGEGAPKSPWWR